ncbi:PREDICTED: uncharacterized protein C10orf95-like, partial [Galeopterus variegatus]|uniref:Uncharacterized protein C10orf95-like n=1 Tax=Galeopterus variegatus TaxID=482537 RepID=A0ABM0SH82_GALVR
GAFRKASGAAGPRERTFTRNRESGRDAASSRAAPFQRPRDSERKGRSSPAQAQKEASSPPHSRVVAAPPSFLPSPSPEGGGRRAATPRGGPAPPPSFFRPRPGAAPRALLPAAGDPLPAADDLLPLARVSAAAALGPPVCFLPRSLRALWMRRAPVPVPPLLLLQLRRREAASTCSSHLGVVSLFCGSAIFVYVRPKASYDPATDPLLSLLCCDRPCPQSHRLHPTEH